MYMDFLAVLIIQRHVEQERLQSVIKKAAVERLAACYGLTHFPEEGIR